VQQHLERLVERLVRLERLERLVPFTVLRRAEL
jgi:hypothetical protein